MSARLTPGTRLVTVAVPRRAKAGLYTLRVVLRDLNAKSFALSRSVRPGICEFQQKYPNVSIDLYLSEQTVIKHVSNILRKLGVPNRAAAAMQARGDHLI